MTWLHSTDLDIWDVIKDGPTIPSKFVDGFMVPKPKYEWDKCDKRNVQLNVKVIYFLQCAIDTKEYNRIC